MKLNKHHKEAFVAAVMADVPQTDYQELARTKAQAFAISLLPDKIKDAYKSHPEYISTRSTYMPGNLCSVMTVTQHDSHYWIQNQHSEFWGELTKIAEQHKAQRERMTDLRSKLTSAIGSVNTLKQALELFPEFEQYLPSESAPTKNLPMISNIVADLTKLGWPKEAAGA